MMPDVQKYDLPDALKHNYHAVMSQINVPYFLHFLSLDIRPLLGKIACPVFALNGTKDSQVDCEANLGAIRNGLKFNEKNRVEALEGLNHLFQHCATGSLAEYRMIEETISPGVLEMIVLWLSSFK